MMRSSSAPSVGWPDERLGEVGVAYVVPRAGQAPEAAELIDFCRARLANFKVPRRVEMVAALPRNAAGKVRKRDLPRQGPSSRYVRSIPLAFAGESIRTT